MPGSEATGAEHLVSWDRLQGLDDSTNDLLESLDYEFTSMDVLAREQRDPSDPILRRRLEAAVRRLNPRLDERDIERALRSVRSAPGEPLIEANERAHRALLGKVRLIDFERPNNNDFTFTRQWPSHGNHRTITSDVVVYVNGIPLVVIERAVASRGESVATAIERLLAHQGLEGRLRGFEAPLVFHSVQLLVASCGRAAKYGTVGTPHRFWSEWRSAASRASGATEAESLGSLLEKSTLLELVRDFMVFRTDDAEREKTLARHAQCTAVRRVMEHVAAARQPAARSGVVYHAHGSGKALTMLFLAGKLQRLAARTGAVVLVVSNRRSMRAPIAASLTAAGHAAPLEMEDAAAARHFIANAKGRTALVSVARFQKAIAGKHVLAGGGERVFVVIDEAFRSEERRLMDSVRRVLPDACVLGFTGAPLEDGRHASRAVGPCIHRYTAEQAVADGAILPVYYEKRRPLVDMKSDRLLRLFGSLFRDHASATSDAPISAPWAAPGRPSRVALVCVDLVDHFERVVRPKGFKAQIIVKNREAAVEMKAALDAIGAFESAVVVSALPSDSERLRRWHTTKEERELVLSRFKEPEDSLSVLVVCDQLLADFDAAVAQVLYVDAPLRDRWLQATARVNRVAPGKTHGLVVDYSTSAKHVARALKAGHLSLPSGHHSGTPASGQESEARRPRGSTQRTSPSAHRQD